MAIRAQSEAEPIPGYKLIERLGGGGFGEVWKAEAPGGLLKAIKFVHGTLTGTQSDAGLVQQELKSLNRVKAVRHPYILSLERYDIVDGQLMIVMELADRNLWDRFEECKKQGLNGIPREELMRYMEETAEALDLMNVQYQLQHLDIKPQNLFLVHNHVKVADFGLVKDLEGINTQVTSGVTPVYAAPETFDGVVSRYCDQYNLAIVYQELLTGQRPYNGTNVRQLLMQHLTGIPELKSLPPADRPIIARALAKKPEDRFPSCSDMVQALRAAGQGIIATPAPPVQDTVRAPEDRRPDMPFEPPPDADIEETPPGVRVRPAAAAAPPPIAAAPPPIAGVHGARPVTMTQAAPPISMTRADINAERGVTTGPVSMTRAAINAERRAVAPPPREESTGNGVLFPAVVVGIGRVGMQVLQQLRRNLTERCGPPELMANLRFLFIDSDPDITPEATECDPDTALNESEVLLCKLNKPSHYLKPGRNRAAIDSWLNMSMICRVPRNQVTTEGLRVLGRLALADNYRTVCSRLRADIDMVSSNKALASADRQTKLGMRTNRPRVYVIASLGGGTGSGMFLDIAYIARQQMAKLGFQHPEVVGLLMLPPVDRGAKKSTGVGNAFASLTELYHFSVEETTYTAFFDESEDPITDKAPPFQRVVMLQLPEESHDPEPLREMAAVAGDFLSRDLVTPVGRKADELREEVMSGPERPDGFVCQTFGSYRYSMPRRVLREQVSRGLVRRLVQSWVAQDRPTVQKAVRARVSEQWDKLGLDPESLIAAMKTDCERSLDRSPEQQFDDILGRCFKGGAEIQPATALATLSQLEQLVGRPTLDVTAVQTRVSEALEQAGKALRRDLEQRLADFLTALMEEPRFRVSGAEEAGQQIIAFLGEAMQTHMALFQELSGKASDSHTHIHALLCNLQKGSWWPGRKAKTSTELRESLEAYPKTRFQSLILQHLLDLYQGLLDTFPKRLEEINYCRQRLGDLQKSIDSRSPAGRAPVDLGPGRHFLPGNARNLDDSIEGLLKNVKPDDLVEMDQKVQSAVRRQFKSLMAVLMGSNDVTKDLQATIQQQVELFVDGLLGKASVAAVYLKDCPRDDQVENDIITAFEEATPKLAGTRNYGPELRLLGVPADMAGERMGKIARSAVEEVEVVLAKDADDVFFYREVPMLPMAELPQLGLMAEEAYRQMVASGHFTPHTRVDIVDWLPPS